MSVSMLCLNLFSPFPPAGLPRLPSWAALFSLLTHALVLTVAVATAAAGARLAVLALARGSMCAEEVGKGGVGPELGAARVGGRGGGHVLGGSRP